MGLKAVTTEATENGPEYFLKMFNQKMRRRMI